MYKSIKLDCIRLLLAFAFLGLSFSVVDAQVDVEMRRDTQAWLDVLDRALVKYDFKATNDLVLRYRLFAPAENNGDLPLLIFLHGRGDRGTDNGRQPWQNIGLFTNEYSILSKEMQEQFPCYVLVPQCSDKTKNEEWAKWVGNTPETPFKGLGKDGSYQMHEKPSDSGRATLELIDHILDTYDIDQDRVYIVGISMGGFGTWEFAARRPDLFAAAVPMAGFSDPGQLNKFDHIPFWIFHGGADKANPVEGSRIMYDLLREHGAEVRYTEYEATGHSEAFHKAFLEKDLIPWIFAHTKGD